MLEKMKELLGANTNRLRALGIDENSRANGSRWGGVQAYWVAEAETAAQSKPKFNTGWSK